MLSSIGQGWPSSAGITLEALGRVIVPDLIEDALKQTGRASRRQRKLPAVGVVWLVIAIGLFAEGDLPSIWRKVVGTLAGMYQALAGIKPACKSAIAAARKRLGARVMRRLFLAVSRPVAQVSIHPGAFYRGLRLLVIDGQKLAVPDSEENARAFGKPSTRRNGRKIDGGYPKLMLTRLMEAGTRVSIEAFIKPCLCHESVVADALIRKAPPDSLLLWDCGFHSGPRLKRSMDRGVHVLGRVAGSVKLQRLRVLSDGSFIACLYPTDKDRRRRTHGFEVRVIRYTLNDPRRVGHRKEHRLVTTLLDEKTYPAEELIALYHERWEIEIDNDEIATHQIARPVELRSRRPAGVVQELYGLLLAHNAVRMLMCESARDLKADPRTLSFMHAVRVIRDAIPLMRCAPTAQLPRLYEALLKQIAQVRLPPRDNRINPRVVKVKMSNYRKKRPGEKGSIVPPFPSVVEVLK